MSTRLVIAGVLAALACGVASGGALIQPIPAPNWEVSHWIYAKPPGDIPQLKGKIVLIEFFQLWCPGCNNFSIPLFNRWAEEYGQRNDVVVVSIHTVFEGHDHQTESRLRQFVIDKEIHHAVGMDSYAEDDDVVPVTMKRFKTEGTPQVVIIDTEGMIRFSHFGEFDPEPVEGFIDRLLEEKDRLAKSKGGRTVSTTKSSAPNSGTKRSRTDSRGRTQRPDPSKTSRPEPEPENEPSLSGRYRVTIEQTDKSCGRPLPPQTVFVDVNVGDDSVEANFTRELFGQRQITAAFDSGGRDFSADVEQTVEDQGTELTLVLSFDGVFSDGAIGTEVSFDFVLETTSADASRDCTIAGRGTGARAGGR